MALPDLDPTTLRWVADMLCIEAHSSDAIVNMNAQEQAHPEARWAIARHAEVRHENWLRGRIAQRLRLIATRSENKRHTSLQRMAAVARGVPRG